MKIGYVRSNARDNFYENQINTLSEMNCTRIFEDIGNSFAELEHMLDYLRSEDTVCVSQMDRFGLNVKHLMKFTSDLMEKNVSLCSVNDGIDTSSAEGELLFKIFNVLSLCEQNAVLANTLSVGSQYQPSKGMDIPENYPNVRMMAPKKETMAEVLPTKMSTAPMRSVSASTATNAAQATASLGGRPRGLTMEAKQKAEAAAAMYQEGILSMREIAGNLNISTATLYSYLRHEKVI